MSVCSPCQKLQPIPKCAESLIVGNVGLIDTDVSVYINDLTTDKLTKIDTVTDFEGNVIFDNCGLMPNHSYELWVTLLDDNIEDKLDIEVINETYPVPADSYSCLSFRVLDVVDCTGAQWSPISFTVELPN